MFNLNRRNFAKFLTKVNRRNVAFFFNSICLYLRVLHLRKLGKHKITTGKRHNRTLLLIHLGVGDFFNMLPAIKYLAKSSKEVHVFVRRAYSDELSRFISESNILLKPIESEEQLDDYYRLNVRALRKRYSSIDLLTTGKFSRKFSFFYPTSYYIELGIDPDVAFDEKLTLSVESLRPEARRLLNRIRQQFIYTHLRASDSEVALPCDRIDRESLILDPFQNRNSRDSEHYEIAQTYLDLKLHLIEHLYFLTQSSECFLIDSSFFNFLAHARYEGKATVFMRSLYFHTLDERLLENFHVIAALPESDLARQDTEEK